LLVGDLAVGASEEQRQAAAGEEDPRCQDAEPEDVGGIIPRLNNA
jgi:hypothetical protein